MCQRKHGTAAPLTWLHSPAPAATPWPVFNPYTTRRRCHDPDGHKPTQLCVDGTDGEEDGVVPSVMCTTTLTRARRVARVRG